MLQGRIYNFKGLFICYTESWADVTQSVLMYLPEWEADNLIQRKNLGFEWVCTRTESWSTEEKGLVPNERVFQRARVLIHGFGVPGCWQDWSCCRGALIMLLPSNVTLWQLSLKIQGWRRKRGKDSGNKSQYLLFTAILRCKQKGSKAEVTAGHRQIGQQISPSELVQAVHAPLGDSDMGAGVCCWVGAGRLGLCTKEGERESTLFVRSPGPASLPGFGEGHAGTKSSTMAAWDAGDGISAACVRLLPEPLHSGNELFSEGCLGWQKPGACRQLNCAVHGQWKDSEQLTYKMQTRY